MFANLFSSSRRPSRTYERGFVEEVRRTAPHRRHPRIERLFVVCWILIAIKSAFVFWAVDHYHIPFSAWWIVAPTLAFAAVVTYIYLKRDQP